jgi:lipopolysaccharide/colanic/teichoic acid biosynthesis glycosyltransferase
MHGSPGSALSPISDASTTASEWALGPAKRVFDILVAGLVVLVTAPLLALVAVVISIGMGRPLLFRQLRLGRSGKAFVIHKFRTMAGPAPADRSLDAHRLTPLGRWLRRWSLDELPQLANVLRGEMSLVGPRPLPIDYAARYSGRQRRRHLIKPGITGLAQVSGRNRTSWRQRFELDLWYVEQASLWLDLRILARSLAVVFSGAGVGPRGAALMPEFQGDRRNSA